MDAFDALQVHLQWRDDGIGEDGIAVFCALCIPNCDLSPFKVQVFYPQASALGYA